jgi:hypothetical protein
MASLVEKIAALEEQRRALVRERHEGDFEMRRLAYQSRVLRDPEATRSLAELRDAAIRRDQRMREIEVELQQLMNRKVA